MADKQTSIIVVLAAILGGGAGAGGNSLFRNSNPRIESLELQVRNMQEVDANIWKSKASKEYVDLKLEALCK